MKIFPGCMTRLNNPGIFEFLKTLNVALGNPDMISGCCGAPISDYGFPYDPEIELNNDEKVMSVCPTCVVKFRSLGYNAVHFVTFAEEGMANGLLKLRNFEDRKASYYDPCHLARNLGIIEEPRELLSKAGFDLIELKWHGSQGQCCGAPLDYLFKDMGNQLAKDRVESIQQLGLEYLVTACPTCAYYLKEQMDESSEELKIMDIAELFVVPK